MQTRLNANKALDIWIYGVITDEKIRDSDITAYDVVSVINGAQDLSSVNVHINSNGGDVYTGIAIYNALIGCGKPVVIIGEGIVASIASVIAMAGKFRMAANAMLMIHNPLLMLSGGFNQCDMERMTNGLDKVRDIITNAYTGKTGHTRDEIINLLDGEDGQGTYLNAQEALALGFCDEVIPAISKPVAQMDCATFRCKGKTYTFAFNNYQTKNTASAVKEGISRMARKTVAKGDKFKAEIMPLECPHCHSMVDFDTSTGIVSPNANEGATVAVPMDAAQACRNAASYRNEVYKIKCPYCEGEFEYDFAPQAGVISPDEPATLEFEAGTPLVQARRSKVKGAYANRNNPPTLKMELTTVSVDCVQCGYTWDVEIDKVIKEATVICPNCGTENIVDTTNTDMAAQPPAPPQEDLALPDKGSPPAAAYQQGVYAERCRVTMLNQRKTAFPQYTNAIDGFIKNGTSVENASNWIFTALASNAKQTSANPAYAMASRRDALPLNKIGNAVGGNDTRGVIAANFASLAQRRGTKK